jgi:hypothetical protein
VCLDPSTNTFLCLGNRIVRRYDPTLNRWSTIAACPEARDNRSCLCGVISSDVPTWNEESDEMLERIACSYDGSCCVVAPFWSCAKKIDLRVLPNSVRRQPQRQMVTPIARGLLEVGAVVFEYKSSTQLYFVGHAGTFHFDLSSGIYNRLTFPVQMKISSHHCVCGLVFPLKNR